MEPESSTSIQSEPSTSTQLEPSTSTQLEPSTSTQSEPSTSTQSEPSTSTQSEPDILEFQNHSSTALFAAQYVKWAPKIPKHDRSNYGSMCKKKILDTALLDIAKKLGLPQETKLMYKYYSKFRKTYEFKLRRLIERCLKRDIEPELALELPGVPQWLQDTEKHLMQLPILIKRFRKPTPQDRKAEFVNRIVTIANHLKKMPKDQSLCSLAKSLKTTNMEVYDMWRRIIEVATCRFENHMAVGSTTDRHGLAAMDDIDWQVVNLLILYEDIKDLVTDESLSCPATVASLQCLCSMVSRNEIEGCSPDLLCKRWHNLYREYIKSHKLHSSLLLLQRRWYELKRNTARVICARINDTSAASPHQLYLDVAAKFPHVVTQPLMPWCLMVKKQLVVRKLDEDMINEDAEAEKNKGCECEALRESLVQQKKADDDVIILENDIETINLWSNASDKKNSSDDDDEKRLVIDDDPPIADDLDGRPTGDKECSNILKENVDCNVTRLKTTSRNKSLSDDGEVSSVSAIDDKLSSVSKVNDEMSSISSFNDKVNDKILSKREVNNKMLTISRADTQRSLLTGGFIVFDGKANEGNSRSELSTISNDGDDVCALVIDDGAELIQDEDINLPKTDNVNNTTKTDAKKASDETCKNKLRSAKTVILAKVDNMFGVLKPKVNIITGTPKKKSHQKTCVIKASPSTKLSPELYNVHKLASMKACKKLDDELEKQLNLIDKHSRDYNNSKMKDTELNTVIDNVKPKAGVVEKMQTKGNLPKSLCIANTYKNPTIQTTNVSDRTKIDVLQLTPRCFNFGSDGGFPSLELMQKIDPTRAEATIIFDDSDEDKVSSDRHETIINLVDDDDSSDKIDSTIHTVKSVSCTNLEQDESPTKSDHAKIEMDHSYAFTRTTTISLSDYGSNDTVVTKDVIESHIVGNIEQDQSVTVPDVTKIDSNDGIDAIHTIKSVNNTNLEQDEGSTVSDHAKIDHSCTNTLADYDSSDPVDTNDIIESHVVGNNEQDESVTIPDITKSDVDNFSMAKKTYGHEENHDISKNGTLMTSDNFGNNHAIKDGNLSHNIGMDDCQNASVQDESNNENNENVKISSEFFFTAAENESNCNKCNVKKCSYEKINVVETTNSKNEKLLNITNNSNARAVTEEDTNIEPTICWDKEDNSREYRHSMHNNTTSNHVLMKVDDNRNVENENVIISIAKDANSSIEPNDINFETGHNIKKSQNKIDITETVCGDRADYSSKRHQSLHIDSIAEHVQMKVDNNKNMENENTSEGIKDFTKCSNTNILAENSINKSLDTETNEEQNQSTVVIGDVEKNIVSSDETSVKSDSDFSNIANSMMSSTSKETKSICCAINSIPDVGKSSIETFNTNGEIGIAVTNVNQDSSVTNENKSGELEDTVNMSKNAKTSLLSNENITLADNDGMINKLKQYKNNRKSVVNTYPVKVENANNYENDYATKKVVFDVTVKIEADNSELGGSNTNMTENESFSTSNLVSKEKKIPKHNKETEVASCIKNASTGLNSAADTPTVNVSNVKSALDKEVMSNSCEKKQSPNKVKSIDQQFATLKALLNKHDTDKFLDFLHARLLSTKSVDNVYENVADSQRHFKQQMTANGGINRNINIDKNKLDLKESNTIKIVKDSTPSIAATVNNNRGDGNEVYMSHSCNRIDEDSDNSDSTDVSSSPPENYEIDPKLLMATQVCLVKIDDMYPKLKAKIISANIAIDMDKDAVNDENSVDERLSNRRTSTDSEHKPTDGESEPTDDEFKPTVHEFKPTDEEIESTDINNVVDINLRKRHASTDSEYKPTDGESEPTDDEFEPAVDELVPTDEEIESTDINNVVNENLGKRHASTDSEYEPTYKTRRKRVIYINSDESDVPSDDNEKSEYRPSYKVRRRLDKQMSIKRQMLYDVWRKALNSVDCNTNTNIDHNMPSGGKIKDMLKYCKEARVVLERVQPGDETGHKEFVRKVRLPDKSSLMKRPTAHVAPLTATSCTTRKGLENLPTKDQLQKLLQDMMKQNTISTVTNVSKDQKTTQDLTNQNANEVTDGSQRLAQRSAASLLRCLPRTSRMLDSTYLTDKDIYEALNGLYSKKEARKRSKHNDLETKASEESEPTKASDDDGYNEWIRQKNLTKHFFDFPQSSTAKRQKTYAGPKSKKLENKTRNDVETVPNTPNISTSQSQQNIEKLTQPPNIMPIGQHSQTAAGITEETISSTLKIVKINNSNSEYLVLRKKQKDNANTNLKPKGKSPEQSLTEINKQENFDKEYSNIVVRAAKRTNKTKMKCIEVDIPIESCEEKTTRMVAKQSEESKIDKKSLIGKTVMMPKNIEKFCNKNSVEGPISSNSNLEVNNDMASKEAPVTNIITTNKNVDMDKTLNKFGEGTSGIKGDENVKTKIGDTTVGSEKFSPVITNVISLAGKEKEDQTPVPKKIRITPVSKAETRTNLVNNFHDVTAKLNSLLNNTKTTINSAKTILESIYPDIFSSQKGKKNITCTKNISGNSNMNKTSNKPSPSTESTSSSTLSNPVKKDEYKKLKLKPNCQPKNIQKRKDVAQVSAMATLDGKQRPNVNTPKVSQNEQVKSTPKGELGRPSANTSRVESKGQVINLPRIEPTGQGGNTTRVALIGQAGNTPREELKVPIANTPRIELKRQSATKSMVELKGQGENTTIGKLEGKGNTTRVDLIGQAGNTHGEELKGQIANTSKIELKRQTASKSTVELKGQNTPRLELELKDANTPRALKGQSGNTSKLDLKEHGNTARVEIQSQIVNTPRILKRRMTNITLPAEFQGQYGHIPRIELKDQSANTASVKLQRQVKKTPHVELKRQAGKPKTKLNTQGYISTAPKKNLNTPEYERIAPKKILSTQRYVLFETNVEPDTQEDIPVAPNIEPDKQKEIPVVPNIEPDAQKIPVALKIEPDTQKEIPVAPKIEPDTQMEIPVAPKIEPVTQEEIPVAPTISSMPMPVVPTTSSMPMPFAPTTSSMPMPFAPTTSSLPMPVAPTTSSMPMPFAPTTSSMPMPFAPTTSSMPMPVAPTTSSMPMPVAPTTSSMPVPVAPPTLSMPMPAIPAEIGWIGLNPTDLSTRAPVTIETYLKGISTKDLPNIDLICVDASKPLLKLPNDVICITDCNIMIAEPTYWSMAPKDKIVMVILNDFKDTEAQGTNYLFINNKMYKKLSQDPLVYARVYHVISDAYLLRQLGALNQTIYTFSLITGAMTYARVRGIGPSTPLTPTLVPLNIAQHPNNAVTAANNTIITNMMTANDGMIPNMLAPNITAPNITATNITAPNHMTATNVMPPDLKFIQNSATAFNSVPLPKLISLNNFPMNASMGNNILVANNMMPINNAATSNLTPNMVYPNSTPHSVPAPIKTDYDPTNRYSISVINLDSDEE